MVVPHTQLRDVILPPECRSRRFRALLLLPLVPCSRRCPWRRLAAWRRRPAVGVARGHLLLCGRELLPGDLLTQLLQVSRQPAEPLPVLPGRLLGLPRPDIDGRQAARALLLGLRHVGLHDRELAGELGQAGQPAAAAAAAARPLAAAEHRPEPQGRQVRDG
eukprot:SAG22_NODE_3565_length_1639_cov_5.132468_2_plen_161_part_01